MEQQRETPYDWLLTFRVECDMQLACLVEEDLVHFGETPRRFSANTSRELIGELLHKGDRLLPRIGNFAGKDLRQPQQLRRLRSWLVGNFNNLSFRLLRGCTWLAGRRGHRAERCRSFERSRRQ